MMGKSAPIVVLIPPQREVDGTIHQVEDPYDDKQFRDAIQEDIDICKKSHKEGKCNHLVQQDISGWNYTVRKCYICDKLMEII